MKTIFLTVYDGDTEKVILRSGVFARLKGANHRIVLLVRVADRLSYYKKEFEKDNVIVEHLPPAMTRLESFWYHLGWNTLPTRAASLRRSMNYRQHHNLVRYIFECLFGFMGNFRAWRELLRLVYSFPLDNYCASYFETYKPDLVFTPNMFSAEDMRIQRAAKRRGIPTIATAKSWDVLTTKAFTRVRADRLLVFNEVNKEESIHIGDYAADRVIVTGFPQFDVYARNEWKLPREKFCASLGLDPKKNIVLMAVPGDWKTSHTRDILHALDRAIEDRNLVNVQILARLHPKYADSSEHEIYRHIVIDRPGTHFNQDREFSIDMGVQNVYQWTFTDTDISHLANSLFHAEVVVNTESTLTLDGAALGKPSVLIAYDGNQKLSYLDSVARIYEREHFQNVVKTGACPIVRSDNELMIALHRFLEDPNYLLKEREILKNRLLYRIDGKSSERTVSAVLELLQ